MSLWTNLAGVNQEIPIEIQTLAAQVDDSMTRSAC